MRASVKLVLASGALGGMIVWAASIPREPSTTPGWDNPTGPGQDRSESGSLPAPFEEGLAEIPPPARSLPAYSGGVATDLPPLLPAVPRPRLARSYPHPSDPPPGEKRNE